MQDKSLKPAELLDYYKTCALTKIWTFRSISKGDRYSVTNKGKISK